MRPPPALKGLIPALVTLFQAGDSGVLDLTALARLTAELRPPARGSGAVSDNAREKNLTHWGIDEGPR